MTRSRETILKKAFADEAMAEINGLAYVSEECDALVGERVLLRAIRRAVHGKRLVRRWIVLVILLCSAAYFMMFSVAELREIAVGPFIKICDDYISVVSGRGDSSMIDGDLAIGYVPDGYDVEMSFDYGYFRRFVISQGDSFVKIEQSSGCEVEYHINADEDDVTTVALRGREIGLITDCEANYYFIWSEDGSLFIVYCDGVTIGEAERIIEGISIINTTDTDN